VALKKIPSQADEENSESKKSSSQVTSMIIDDSPREENPLTQYIKIYEQNL
jgi:hypothetical protein